MVAPGCNGPLGEFFGGTTSNEGSTSIEGDFLGRTTSAGITLLMKE